MYRQELKWTEAIMAVLQSSEEALHYTEIAQEIIDRGYRTSVGATPSNTVNAVLGSSNLQPWVDKVSPGIYRLRKLGNSVTPRPNIAPIDDDEADLLAQQEKEEHEEEMGLINAFGMYWARNMVDWDSKLRIYGMQQGSDVRVDFSDQAGVYLLHDGSRTIYVGRAGEGRLGSRLLSHTRNRLTSRWDRFSWFGVRGVKSDGGLSAIPNKLISIDTLISTMEALLIEGLEPPQNRQRGEGFGATEFIQMEDPKLENKRRRDVLNQALSNFQD